MSFREKYPSLYAILGDIIIASLELAKKGKLWEILLRYKFKNGEQIFWNGKKGNKVLYYVMDRLHKNHWEMYSKGGRPVAAIDFDGIVIKQYHHKDNRKWLDV